MNAAPVFERVYAALKHRLRAGALAPTARLDPTALADQLAASVTPVRDALHRLAGERLVLARQDGFQVPALSEPDLRDLYAWNQQLLLLALRGTHRSPLGGLDPPSPELHSAEVAEIIFRTIAQVSGNREQAFAVDALNDRLHAARRAELGILSQIGGELADMIGADLRTLRTLIGRYHRRRLAAVPHIVRALHRPAN
jgi:hypothetical protein